MFLKQKLKLLTVLHTCKYYIHQQLNTQKALKSPSLYMQLTLPYTCKAEIQLSNHMAIGNAFKTLAAVSGCL